MLGDSWEALCAASVLRTAACAARHVHSTTAVVGVLVVCVGEKALGE